MTAPAPQLLRGHGFTVQPPAGWEARIYRRTAPTVPDNARNRAAAAGRTGWLGEQTLPVVHLADFPLPASRGDYGSGAVESMRAGNMFLAILEFGAECLGTALYQEPRPKVQPNRFSPNGLQRILPGQCGAQYFFTENRRPLCLYVVLGSQTDLARSSARVNAVLNSLAVDSE
jgi:hypothetical protein